MSPYLVSTRGGIALYVDRLSHYLRASGHHVDVLTIQSPARNSETKPGPRRSVSTVRLAWITYAALSRIRPDVVHVHGHWFQLLGALLYRAWTGSPVVFTQHTLPVARYAFGKRLLESRLLSATDAVCAPCQATLDALTQVAGLRILSKCRVVGGAPVDPDSTTNADTTSLFPTIGFCSLLVHREKLEGALDLLAAFAAMVPAIPSARMVVVGGSPDGSAEAIVRRRISELGLDTHVDFRGTSHSPWAELRAISVFVHSSRRDSLSLSLLEAMARALPIVATDVGGTREAIENEVTGLLVSPGDVRGLSAAMLRLLRDEPFARELGNRAAETVRARFNWPTVAGAHADLYSALLQRRRVH